MRRFCLLFLVLWLSSCSISQVTVLKPTPLIELSPSSKYPQAALNSTPIPASPVPRVEFTPTAFDNKLPPVSTQTKIISSVTLTPTSIQLPYSNFLSLPEGIYAIYKIHQDNTLYAMNLDDSIHVPIILLPATIDQRDINNRDYSLSPDGLLFAYSMGAGKLKVLNAIDNSIMEIKSGDDCKFPTWSANSRKLAAVCLNNTSIL